MIILSLIAIAYVLTVTVLCVLWYRTAVDLRKTLQAYAKTVCVGMELRDHLQDEVDTTRNDRDYWQDIASAHFVTLQTIARYMIRRPPRRRWLAIARRVARDATRTPLTVKR